MSPQELRLRMLERHAEQLAALARAAASFEATEEQRQEATRKLIATAMWKPL